ncbi:MAG: nucleoside-triphosphatase [Bacteroidota bacterium]
MMIYVFSGDVQSAKTTRLLNWCNGRKNIAGILTPVIDQKRYFLNVLSGEKMLMEAPKEERNVQAIGRFVFSSDAFVWAEKILADAMDSDAELIVIDEIGPLELQGKGFHNILLRLLESNIKNLLLVVRSSKLEEVIANYNLHQHTLKVISDPEKELPAF